MEFSFEGRCVLVLDHKEGAKTSTHVQTKFNLDVSKNLDRKIYLDSEDLPTAAGSKSLTNVFIQGLVGNIHHAQQKGYWDESEHIRFIISELQRGFVGIAETGKSTF